MLAHESSKNWGTSLIPWDRKLGWFREKSTRVTQKRNNASTFTCQVSNVFFVTGGAKSTLRCIKQSSFVKSVACRTCTNHWANYHMRVQAPWFSIASPAPEKRKGHCQIPHYPQKLNPYGRSKWRLCTTIARMQHEGFCEAIEGYDIRSCHRAGKKQLVCANGSFWCKRQGVDVCISRQWSHFFLLFHIARIFWSLGTSTPSPCTIFFPQQQNAMWYLHNIDFGVFWASRLPGTGSRFRWVLTGSFVPSSGTGSGNWFRFSWVRSCEGSRFQRLRSAGLESCRGFAGFGGCGFRWFRSSESGCGFEGFRVPRLMGFAGFWRFRRFREISGFDGVPKVPGPRSCRRHVWPSSCHLGVGTRWLAMLCGEWMHLCKKELLNLLAVWDTTYAHFYV